MELARIVQNQRELADRIARENAEKRDLVRRLELVQMENAGPVESRLLAAIKTAIAEGVLPSARKGNTHKEGAETVGLLIEKETRERLLMEARRRGIFMDDRKLPTPNYRRTVMTALRVGLAVLEQMPLEDAPP